MIKIYAWAHSLFFIACSSSRVVKVSTLACFVEDSCDQPDQLMLCRFVQQGRTAMLLAASVANHGAASLLHVDDPAPRTLFDVRHSSHDEAGGGRWRWGPILLLCRSVS